MVYDFEIDETRTFMQISFQTDQISRYQTYQSSEIKGSLTCSQSTTIDPENNTVTFIHERTILGQENPQLPLNYNSALTVSR